MVGMGGEAGRRPWVGDVLLPIEGAARRARDVVTQACVQWEVSHLVAPSSLVATELVTNAVEHAGTMADLRVVRGRRYLLIVVCDGSPAVPVMPERSLIAAHRDNPRLSRGLILVDVTAIRWGCRPIDGGKLVWAALRIVPAS